jgi:hypothetical protein
LFRISKHFVSCLQNIALRVSQILFHVSKTLKNTRILRSHTFPLKIASLAADTCPALPVFQFGERLLHFGDGIGFGSVYEFQCARGYRREGPASIVCQPDGQWSAAQPQCKSGSFGIEIKLE